MGFGTCFIILLHSWLLSAAEFKLSDSKLLLPYYSYASVNYTITGSGGSCYEWWSGTPEVVTVTPIGVVGQSCTNKASVASIWQSPLRATSTIYARDYVTGHVLKCDIIVDDIHSIKVDTTTQELYLHNTPESLVVVGYDEFGNTFSSLDGIPFEWRIYAGSETTPSLNGNGVLRFLTWTESEYTTPSRIGALEVEGMQGYMQLVSGLRTGSAVVSAALRESVYNKVVPAKVRLLVMANAQLTPPVLYLMPSAVAKFCVFVVRQDNDEEISMPSKQYYLTVSDSEIVELSATTGATIMARNYGQTTVTLLDRNVEEAIGMLGTNLTDPTDTETQLLAHHRRPMSIVYVVEPAYFRFSVQPTGEAAMLCLSTAYQSSMSSVSGQKKYNQWSLETDKEYQLSLELFDQNNHRIFLSDNSQINVAFPDDVVDVLESSQNGTIHTIKPLKKGPFTVKATLTGVTSESGELLPPSHPITGSQDLLVYSPLTLLPESVNIAWDPSTNGSGGYALAVTGGSGDYFWTVLEDTTPQATTYPAHSDSVVTVSSTGIITAKAFGTAIVAVSDLRNPTMCSRSKVRVSQLSSMGFSIGRVEVYLPKRPLSSQESRLLSVISARSIAIDTADLVPDPNNDYIRPMSKVEKKNNAVLAIGLTAIDSESSPITDCHNLKIEIQSLDSGVAKVLPGLFYLPPSDTLNTRVCAYFRVIGLREGFTELEASYAVGDSAEEQKASARYAIAVYKHVEFFDEETVIAVAVGSSRRISHAHGPQPWRLEPGSHFVELKFAAPGQSEVNVLPSVRQRPQPGVLQTVNTSMFGHTFVLRCECSGTFEVSVVIGNRPSTTNPMPAVLSAPMTLLCELPSKIQLTPHLDLPVLPPGLPPCPFVNRSFGGLEDIVPVSNNGPLRVEIVFKGPSGYELTGVDSITTVAHVSVENGKIGDIVEEREPKIMGFRQFADSELIVSRPGNPYFHVSPRSPGVSEGRLEVRVGANHQWPGEPSSSLEAQLSLNMASSVVVQPLDDFQLLLHPQATGEVHLADGSGFFHFSVLPSPTDSNVNSNNNNNNRACLTVSNHPGGDESASSAGRRDFWLTPRCRGVALLRVTDLCFPAAPGAKLPATRERTVSIVGLGALRLYAPSQMELLSKAPIYVRAIDTEGNVLPAKFSNLLDLNVISSSSSSESQPVSVTTSPRCPESSPLGTNSPGGGGVSTTRDFWLRGLPSLRGDQWGLARLELCGQGLGLSKLKVVSGDVTSNIAVVNVFAPMRLEPCNMNLLLGAAHQVTAQGGPSPRTLTFTVTPIAPVAGAKESRSTTRTPKVTAIQIGGGASGSSSGSGAQQSEDSVLVRSDATTAGGHTGAVNVTGRAVSSGGYVDLDSKDFGYWELTPPPKTVFSATSCQVNVVALSSIRIGCPLPLSESGRRLLIASSSSTRTNSNRSSSVSSGGVPVWAEGIADGGNGEVTPMGLADIQPPLHFSWRLSPPMPNGPAELFHWLNQLQVDPKDTSLSSGMILLGSTPGQVKLQLTVFTEEKAPTGQLVSSDDNRVVSQLSAEMAFTVVPHLDLLTPLRSNPRILVSPNSELHLKLPAYILTDGGFSYSVDCISPNLVQVSQSGLLRSNASGICDAWSNWRLAECRCGLRIDYRSGGNSVSHSERSHQSLSLDVVVKPPLYVMARADASVGQAAGAAKPMPGLPFGGPFATSLSFHDELGETFDAVSDDFLSVRVKAHRSNLLDYSIAPASLGNMGRLLLRLTPPLHTITESSQPHIQAVTAISLFTCGSGAGLSPTYLTIPTGHLFDVFGSSEFAVGQWACLPNLALGEGDWSSSDTSILWIDNQSNFMLPLRQGHVHLQFTPKKASAEDSPRTSLMGMLNVVSVCDDGGSDGTKAKTTANATPSRKPEITGSSLMPVGLDPVGPQQEALLRFRVAGQIPTAHGSCLGGVSQNRLAELSPFTCSLRLEQPTSPPSSAHLPTWLRAYLLAEHYASSALSVMPSADLLALPAASASSSSSVADFEARLVPSAVEAGVWNCAVRTTPGVGYARFAQLAPGSRLLVDVKGVQGCGDAGAVASEAVASSDLKLVPEFRVIVPPIHLSGSFDSSSSTLLLTPRSTRATILVFIPPATLADMESTGGGSSSPSQLKARSQRPDLLAVDGAPRSVHSAAPVKAALDRMVADGSMKFGSLLANISRMMENEAIVSAEQAFGNGLIWAIGVKSMPTRTATDAMVEVVLSLKTTGQHVSVPLRVQTRTTLDNEDDAPTDGPMLTGRMRGGLWPSLSWLHLLLLIFLTFMLLLASHLVGRSLNSGGFGGTGSAGSLPELPNSPAQTQSTPRLWSQGGYTVTTPFASPKVGGTPPYGDTATTAFGGQTPGPGGYPRSRYHGASSPSRLREAFDTSL